VRWFDPYAARRGGTLLAYCPPYLLILILILNYSILLFYPLPGLDRKTPRKTISYIGVLQIKNKNKNNVSFSRHK
jgi:hypothetical protein